MEKAWVIIVDMLSDAFTVILSDCCRYLKSIHRMFERSAGTGLAPFFGFLQERERKQGGLRPAGHTESEHLACEIVNWSI